MLIAALLELKSRLMLSGEEEDELLDIEPAQAAEELLERMLEARRYRAAAGHLGELLQREEGVRFREAPLPANLRKTVTQPSDGSQNPDLLGEALGRLLRIHRRSICATLACRRSRLRSAWPACAAFYGAGAQLRRGRAGRRSDDGRGHAVRAARALQARRGRLGAGGELGNLRVRARAQSVESYGGRIAG